MVRVTTLGIALIALALVDLLATAVSVGHGVGPVSGPLARGVWTVPALGRVRHATTIVLGRGSSAVAPATGIDEILEPIAAMTGLTTLSLSIAYVLPIVRGVVAKARSRCTSAHSVARRTRCSPARGTARTSGSSTCT